MATFTQGDYEYAYDSGSVELAVEATDKTKTTYGTIPAYINHNGTLYVVTSANQCFKDCTNLTSVGGLPETLVDMGYCFEGCTSLVNAPQIPYGVIHMESCFTGCTSLVNAPVIPASVYYANYAFSGCTNLEGYVFIDPRGYVVARSAGLAASFDYIFYHTTKDIYAYLVGTHGQETSMSFKQSNIRSSILQGAEENVYFMCEPQDKITYNRASTYMLNKNSSGSITQKSFCPETNANIIQVEIPSVTHRGGYNQQGSKLTVSLYDALMDLENRAIGG